MAGCSSCGPEAGTETLDTEFDYVAKTTTVMGRDRKPHAINQPLMSSSVKPDGGWKATIRIKGIRREFDEDTPLQVFNEVARVAALNGERINAMDLWLNLNIQWLARTSDRHKMVDLAELMKVADPQAPMRPETHVGDKDKYPPQEWGATGWGMLQIYLAQKVYAWGEFRMLAEQLLKWVNPSINPNLGCADCYRSFSLAVGSALKDPLLTQEEARRWLVNTMNTVNSKTGKPIFSYEQASKLHRWT